MRTTPPTLRIGVTFAVPPVGAVDGSGSRQPTERDGITGGILVLGAVEKVGKKVGSATEAPPPLHSP